LGIKPSPAVVIRPAPRNFLREMDDLLIIRFFGLLIVKDLVGEISLFWKGSEIFNLLFDQICIERYQWSNRREIWLFAIEIF
jgi:hypothetical protein